MRRHKHLRRLERLRDAINKRYGKYKTYEYMKESDFPDGGVWAIWLGLLKDIKECGLSVVFKIDGIRLYYYNELWKKVNNKDHKSFPEDGISPQSQVYFHEMKFDGPMERAEWLAKLLSEQIYRSPPAIWETCEIAVNTWPTSRWLGEQIAFENGINALIRFPFPGNYFRKIVRTMVLDDQL